MLVEQLSRCSWRCVAALVVCSLSVPAQLAAAQRELPEKFQTYPYTVRSLTIGHPNRGWQVRAKRLRPLPYLKIKVGSEEHSYGHPALVLMLRRSAADLHRSVPGSVMLVGDLSREKGGPLHGHFSHQSGRDADVGFYVKDQHGKSVLPKKFVAFGGDGRAKDGSGFLFDDYRNWLLVQSWVKDQRAGLSHIFVSHALRARLLRYAQSVPEFRQYLQQAAALLKQPEYASPHDDHFHVRIACPESQLGPCKNESKR